ncbi:MAG TPA: division/cell wall cluster transcriptional repressor MraZ [Dehalococcoidia bacterium]|jgi:MraZ protein|nr:division/cell wall cluster transcriptional repressor MraZ [Dehalococcoidia bacterium]
MLFLGRHEYAMDERGRVPMPPRFRDALMHGMILTQGTPDHCIRAYPSTNFEEQASLYMNEPVTTRTGRVMRRAFFSGAYQAELDRQGRVLIPPPLREYANLDNQVVVVGTGEGIEIWNAGDFESAIGAEEGAFLRSLGSGDEAGN